jgi:cytochrome c peroxidase
MNRTYIVAFVVGAAMFAGLHGLLSAQSTAPIIPPDLITFVTPADNPTTDAKVALGQKLFDDKRLSADNTVSCETCHDPNAGFTARLETAKGIRDQVGKRNTPTIINAMFLTTQFWDGRAPTLDEQAKMPIVNPIEMGMKDGQELAAKLSAIPEYAAEFNKVFGRPLNYDDVGRAIAAFERTVMSGEAPIDRFLRGNENALTPAQRRGWSLFNGKGRCNTCHAFNATYPFFTDNKFHNIGIAAHKQDFTELATRAERAITTGKPEEIDRLALETDFSELGRFLVTRNRADIGAFKTPGLREIVLTSPYMHDGSLPTLWDVMDHYNKGGEPNPFLDGGIQRLGLEEDEINDLVELMAAFTSDKFAAPGNMELTRQRTFSRGPRSTRDTDAAMGRKMGRGDAVPNPDKKDPALIGGRPVSE